jgi:hypothetical protein
LEFFNFEIKPNKYQEMKLKYIVAGVFFLLGSQLNTSAQVEGYLKSKAKVATNRAKSDADGEVNSNINKAVDKQFNKLKGKVLDKDGKETEQQGGETQAAPQSQDNTPPAEESKGSSNNAANDAMGMALMGKMGINMQRPATMRDVYEYTGNVKMDIENWNEDGESQGPVDYTTLYSEKNSGFAMEFKDKEKGKSEMIFDYDGQWMIILSDNGSDRSGIATPLAAYQPDSMNAASNGQSQSAGSPDTYSSFKKSGKSKSIAGYNCDEYVYEDEDDYVSYWITTELPADLWARVGTSTAFASVYAGRANGFVMESDHQIKRSKERSHMIVKEVNRNQPGKISTIGYTIMSMGTPPPPPPPADDKGKKDKN